jgi:hypothetical protein
MNIRTYFGLGYGAVVTAWIVAGPWIARPESRSRALTLDEQMAFRGGAPGPCSPQNGGACLSDPIGNGCNIGSFSCDDTDCAKNNLNPGDECADGNDGSDLNQCQPNQNSAGACANVNPIEAACIDNYVCDCNDNNDCSSVNKETTSTGTCVTSN